MVSPSLVTSPALRVSRIIHGHDYRASYAQVPVNVVVDDSEQWRAWKIEREKEMPSQVSR